MRRMGNLINTGADGSHDRRDACGLAL